MAQQWFTARGARLAVAFVAATIGTTACEGVLGNDETGPTTISFRTAGSSTLSVSDGAALAGIPVTGGGHTVDVQAVDVLFDEVTLERRGEADDLDSEEDSDSDGRGKERFHAGAITVSLPLDNGSVTPISQIIPHGAYDELEMDAAFVRVKGTYDGLPFDVTVPVNAEIESNFNPPFVVDGDDDRPNVTVKVDVLSWFRDANGVVIDPRRLATDANLRAQFRNRVRASFRAIEDHDRDGDDQDSDSDDSDSR